MAKLLIVDDEELVRSMLGQFLEMEGYDCTLAANTAEARTYLSKDCYDLILSDQHMPGESGLDFLYDVFTKHPGTAAIMVTAFGDSHLRKRAIEIGVDAYIVKPFRVSEVVESVARSLSRKHCSSDDDIGSSPPAPVPKMVHS